MSDPLPVPEANPVSPENQPRLEYMAVGNDILTLIDLKEGIDARLDAAIRNLGADPLDFRGRLNSVMNVNGDAPSGRRRKDYTVQRMDKPFIHAIWEYGKKMGSTWWSQADCRIALEAQGYNGRSVSPSLSRSVDAGIIEVKAPDANRPNHLYRLSRRGAEEVQIVPGTFLTEKQLQRLGWLRGKNEKEEG